MQFVQGWRVVVRFLVMVQLLCFGCVAFGMEGSIEFVTTNGSAHAYSPIFNHDLIVQLGPMQHEFELNNVFGAPEGYVSSEVPGLLERYLKEREGKRGRVVFVENGNERVQLRVLREVAQMVKAGEFVNAQGDKFNTKNITFVLEDFNLSFPIQVDISLKHVSFLDAIKAFLVLEEGESIAEFLKDIPVKQQGDLTTRSISQSRYRQMLNSSCSNNLKNSNSR